MQACQKGRCYVSVRDDYKALTMEVYQEAIGAFDPGAEIPKVRRMLHLLEQMHDGAVEVGPSAIEPLGQPISSPFIPPDDRPVESKPMVRVGLPDPYTTH